MIEELYVRGVNSYYWDIAIITILNNVRLSAGKPPIGFANPFLYQTYASNPSAFNDITVGKSSVRFVSCCYRNSTVLLCQKETTSALRRSVACLDTKPLLVGTPSLVRMIA